MAQRVGRLFDVLRPAGVVSAPAAGSDLLVLDQARQRGIPLHVLMPINADEFVRASVADHDAEWLDLYRSVLDHARSDADSTVYQIDKAERDDWFLDANDDLLMRAAELADGELVIALTVRPPAGEIPHSTSDDFADRAGKAGWIVLTVDPRPGSTTAEG